VEVTLKTGETATIPPGSPVEVPECGCCGHYHLAPLKGLFTDDYRDDCRFNASSRNRSARMEILAPRPTVKSSTAGRVPIPCRSNRWLGTSETVALPST